jgi:uncharacterized protein YjcR
MHRNTETPLGAWLRGAGMSAGDLADVLGVSPQAVRSWVRGASFPRPAHGWAVVDLSAGALTFAELYRAAKLDTQTAVGGGPTADCATEARPCANLNQE